MKLLEKLLEWSSCCGGAARVTGERREEMRGSDGDSFTVGRNGAVVHREEREKNECNSLLLIRAQSQ